LRKLIIKKRERKTVMAVKLRMARMGRRHRPFFRINAIDSRKPRDGRILEKLGHYDPIEKDKNKQVVLNLERVQYWLDKGAIPSDTVSQILLRLGVRHKYATEKAATQAKARALAHAKGRYFTKADKIAADKAAVAAEEVKVEAEAKEKTAVATEEVKVEVKAKEKTTVATEEVKVEVKAKKKAAVKTKEKVGTEEKFKTETKTKAVVKEKTEVEIEAVVETKAKAAEEESQPKATPISKSDEN
jgi:small subunit ribosomal protein S16